MRSLPFSFLVVALAHGIAAQTPFSSNDSAVVALVGQTIIEHTADLITRTTFDTTAIPLEITLPTDDPTGRWRRLDDRLMRLLHGRPVRPTDDARQQVVLARLRISGDTVDVVVEVTIGCRGSRGYRFGAAYLVTNVFDHRRWVLVRSGQIFPYDVIACRAWW